MPAPHQPLTSADGNSPRLQPATTQPQHPQITGWGCAGHPKATMGPQHPLPQAHLPLVPPPRPKATRATQAGLSTNTCHARMWTCHQALGWLCWELSSVAVEGAGTPRRARRREGQAPAQPHAPAASPDRSAPPESAPPAPAHPRERHPLPPHLHTGLPRWSTRAAPAPPPCMDTAAALTPVPPAAVCTKPATTALSPRPPTESGRDCPYCHPSTIWTQSRGFVPVDDSSAMHPACPCSLGSVPMANLSPHTASPYGHPIPMALALSP